MTGRPARLKLLVPVSALLVAGCLAAGMYPQKPWLVEIVLVTAVVQGGVAGSLLPRYWRGPPATAIPGAGGRYLGFVAAVTFAAVEAHAVGFGLGSGAPLLGGALLLPPVVVAGVALRSAERRVTSEMSEGEGA